MTKTSHYHRLELHLPDPALLEPVQAEIQKVQDFITYYEVDAALMKAYTARVQREELEMLAAYYNPENEPIDTDDLLNGTREPDNDISQKLLNLRSLLKSEPAAKEEINLVYLKKLQGVMHQLLLNDGTGVGMRMETNSLFGAPGADAAVQPPLEADTKDWLDDILKMVTSKEIPVLYRAFLFYYYFTVVKPFADNNEILAYLVCKRVLVGARLDFFSLLNLEKYIFRDKEVNTIFHLLTAGESFHGRLHIDTAPYLEACVKAFTAQVAAVKETVTQAVRDQLDYAGLTPRQKNSLNFWLEKAFYIHKDKLEELTPRQHEIMLLIAKHGSLSNKDLVPVFQVDRKTIQRDFNSLLDLKLLDQRGGGRALKYYLNMRVEI